MRTKFLTSAKDEIDKQMKNLYEEGADEYFLDNDLREIGYQALKSCLAKVYPGMVKAETKLEFRRVLQVMVQDVWKEKKWSDQIQHRKEEGPFPDPASSTTLSEVIGSF